MYRKSQQSDWSDSSPANLPDFATTGRQVQKQVAANPFGKGNAGPGRRSLFLGMCESFEVLEIPRPEGRKPAWCRRCYGAVCQFPLVSVVHASPHPTVFMEC